MSKVEGNEGRKGGAHAEGAAEDIEERGEGEEVCHRHHHLVPAIAKGRQNLLFPGGTMMVVLTVIVMQELW